MKNMIFLVLAFQVIVSCKKKADIYTGADFNEITFEALDTIFNPGESKTFGIFTVDAHGLALEKIQFEAELETWEEDEDIENYIEKITFSKITPGNKVALIDSSYTEGSCTHEWTLINQEHLIDPMDKYQLNIRTKSIFDNDHLVTSQIAFYIRNLFDDIEIIHGGSILGFPDKIYFQN